MLKLTKGQYISSDRYLSDLEYLGYVYVNIDVLKEMYRKVYLETKTELSLCNDIVRSMTGYSIMSIDKKPLVRFFMEVLDVPESKFRKGETFPSLDQKEVLSRIYDEYPATHEMLDAYFKYTSKKKLSESINGLISRCIPTDKKNYLGEELYKVNFEINPIENLRYAYRNYSIQTIPKPALDCLQAPEGYVIVSGDLNQADARIDFNMMLRTPENLKVMEKTDDLYEGYSRIYLKENFDLEDFKANRQNYKVNCLAPTYGAKTATTAFGTKFIQAANESLQECPAFVEFNRRINRKLDLQLPIRLESYFGHITTILPKTPSKQHKGFMTREELLDKCLNTPVQTGTSEVIKAITNSIMDKFEELGYTSENGSIYSYINRHDEMVFLIKEELLKYSYIFQNHQTIQIDDWIPMTTTFDYSRIYKREDKEMQELAESNYLPKEEEFGADLSHVKEFKEPSIYIPTDDVKELCIGVSYFDSNSLILSYLDTLNNTCSFDKLDKTDDKSILEAVTNRLNLFVQNNKNCGCSAFYVYSTLIKEPYSINKNILICFSNNFATVLQIKANILAEYVKHELLIQNNVETPMSDTLKNNISYVKSVIEKGESLDGGGYKE